MRKLAISIMLVSGVLCGCSTIDRKITQDDFAISQKVMGKPISDNPITLFGGDLTVRAYQNGVVFAKKDGSLVKYTISKVNRSQQPPGLVADQYKVQGGANVFGEFIQGEHRFNDTKDTLYCFSIYEKGLIVYRWGGDCEAAIFDKAFTR